MEKIISIRRSELRTTVFKRALENNYVLKTQKARQFLAEVGKKFPTLPFSLRAFDETIGHQHSIAFLTGRACSPPKDVTSTRDSTDAF